jgi:hypothetical protein
MKTNSAQAYMYSGSYVSVDENILASMAGNEHEGDKHKFAMYLHKQGAVLDLYAVKMEPTPPDHPDFDMVYSMLYGEFGAKGEVETQDVLRKRCGWDPLHPLSGQPPLEYRLVILKHPRRQVDHGRSDDMARDGAIYYSYDGQEIIGVRDHSMIFRDGIVIVHLSHSLLVDYARHIGLDTILRAIPVMHAKSFARRIGHPDAPIILYAEQEPVPTIEEIQKAAFHHLETGDAADIDSINMRFRRLAAYQGGAFKKIGKNKVCMQPDFSTSDQITAKGGPEMVDLNGIWRFVGREETIVTTGSVLRTVVSAIYDMYEASGLDRRATAQARESLGGYPRDDEVVPLILPLEPLNSSTCE